MRLFLDANVLFTAAYTAGRARALFQVAEGGGCEILSSAHAASEARRNVAAKAPEGTSRLLEKLMAEVEIVPEADPRLVRWAAEQGLPANDAPIVASAVAARADALVTGDRRHFGRLCGTSPGGVEIVTPAAALDRVIAGS